MSEGTRYKYRLLLSDGLWRFELLPNNSNTQIIGYSQWCKTEQDARVSLARFKRFMHSSDWESGLEVNERKTKTGVVCSYLIRFSEDNEVFTSKREYQKREIHNAIRRLKKNFDADVKIVL